MLALMLIVSAAARLQSQPAIGPELPLAAEPVRRLHSRRQHGRTDRAEKGNGTQPLADRMLLALQHQILSGLPA